MLRTCAVSSLFVAFLVVASPALAQAPAGSGAQQWQQSPAQAADPPLLPAPTPNAPLSTSGTDVAPPAPTAPFGPATATDEHGRGGEPGLVHARNLETRLALDEARLKTLETDVGPLRHLHVMGFVQLQYLLQSLNANASPNRLSTGGLPAGISSNDVIAKSDGTTTNTNAFRLRRTRLGATYETDVMRVFLQLDLFPSGGPAATSNTIARNAEATGIAHWTKDVRTEFTGGLFQIPMRMELEESSLFRPFIERTWASLNMFPTERDIGIHAKTFAMDDRLSFDFGVINGQRLGEPKIALQPDLNSSKDFFGNVTLRKLGPLDASVAGYVGRGQLVDSEKLRVKNFNRYALNVGLRFARELLPMLGETRFVGEILFGKNMDTGVVYAFGLPPIPPTFNDDVAGFGERALYLRAEQDLTRWGILGFRYDTYTTNVAVSNDARDTYTFMLGARFNKNLRLINELSYSIDNIHPMLAEAPSQHILSYSAWLQGSFY